MQSSNRMNAPEVIGHFGLGEELAVAHDRMRLGEPLDE